MNVLLDTHVLLWWLQNDPDLLEHARALIADPDNEIFVSSVSGWEIAPKVRLGKLPGSAILSKGFRTFFAKAG